MKNKNIVRFFIQNIEFIINDGKLHTTGSCSRREEDRKMMMRSCTPNLINNRRRKSSTLLNLYNWLLLLFESFSFVYCQQDFKNNQLHYKISTLLIYFYRLAFCFYLFLINANIICIWKLNKNWEGKVKGQCEKVFW